MAKQEITVHFSYNAEPQETLKCKSNEPIENVCKEIASRKNLNFNSIYFLLGGMRLDSSQYQKPVSDYISKLYEGHLIILLYDAEKNDEKIEVCFYFKGFMTKIEASITSIIIDIIRLFASLLEKDYNKLNYKYKESSLDLNKKFEETITPIDKNIGKIEIFVEEKKPSQNKEIKFCFWFQEQPHEIDGRLNSKLIDIFRLYALEVRKNIDDLNFKYKDEKLDNEKTINDYATLIDINAGIIDIIVEDINDIRIINSNQGAQRPQAILSIQPIQRGQTLEPILSVQRNPSLQLNEAFGRSHSFLPNQSIYRRQPYISTQHIQTNDERFLIQQEPVQNLQIMNPAQDNGKKNESFLKNCSVTKWVIGIISFLIIIAIILIIVFVIIRKRKKKTEPKPNPILVSRCEKFKDNSNDECELCKDEFEKYKGNCLRATFYVFYKVSYDNERIQLFNPEKLNNLIAIAINNEVREPNTELSFDNVKNNIVFYYLNEKTPISLSNMFQNNQKILKFLFNYDSMDDFIITDMKNMFSGCINLEDVHFYLFEGKELIDISGLFSNCISLTSLNLPYFDTSNIKYMNNSFYNCHSLSQNYFSNFIGENAINISSMFYNCSLLDSISFTKINTRNVIDMSFLFFNCTSLSLLNITQFYTNNVYNMSFMFANCNKLKFLNLEYFNTQNVIDMSYMFKDCNSLTSIVFGNLNTEKVRNMDGMFYNCNSLTSLDLSNFNTQNIISMKEIFYGCSSLKYIDISSFIIEKDISIFSELPNDCTMKININSNNKISTIPDSCNIIFQDR